MVCLQCLFTCFPYMPISLSRVCFVSETGSSSRMMERIDPPPWTFQGFQYFALP